MLKRGSLAWLLLLPTAVETVVVGSTVAIVFDSFDRVAGTVAGKMAGLLDAGTAVLDENGVVVASDEPRMVGVRFDGLPISKGDHLRVPLRVDNRDAEIVVLQPPDGEAISPKLAQVIADLIVNQTEVVDRIPTDHALKNKFIHDLLIGDVRDEATILREAEVLGMDFSVPRAVILIDASRFILANQTDLQDQYLTMRRGGAGHRQCCRFLRSSQRHHLRLHRRRRDRRPQGEQHQRPVRMDGERGGQPAMGGVVGQPHRSEASGTGASSAIDARYSFRHQHRNRSLPPWNPRATQSYADARAALRLGSRFHGVAGVHCLDGLGLASLVGISDEATKLDLARHLQPS